MTSACQKLKKKHYGLQIFETSIGRIMYNVAQLRVH